MAVKPLYNSATTKRNLLSICTRPDIVLNGAIADKRRRPPERRLLQDGVTSVIEGKSENTWFALEMDVDDPTENVCCGWAISVSNCEHTGTGQGAHEGHGCRGTEGAPCRKQISSGYTLKRRYSRFPTPKPTRTSRVCLILRGPGRKRHYERATDLWAIKTAVLSFRQIEKTSIVR